MSQIKRKFIGADQVSGDKVLLDNAQALRAKLANGEAAELLKLDADGVLQFMRLPRVASDAVSGNDIVRKSQLDSELTSVESTLQSEIDGVSARVSGLEADPVTKSYVDQQVSGAITTAEGYTDSQVSALIDGAASGYNTLKKLQTKVEFILSNSDPAAIDSLSEVVNAFQNADGSLSGAISSLASAAASGLEDERLRAQGVESALSGAINAAVSGYELADLDFLKLDGSRPMVGDIDFDVPVTYTGADLAGWAAIEGVSLQGPINSTGYTITTYYYTPQVGDEIRMGAYNYGNDTWSDYSIAQFTGTSWTIQNLHPDGSTFNLLSVTQTVANQDYQQFALTYENLPRNPISNNPLLGWHLVRYTANPQAPVYKITGLMAGSAAGDAVNKGQLDGVESALSGALDAAVSGYQLADLDFLKLNGSRSMTGDLKMGHQRIFDVAKLENKVFDVTFSGSMSVGENNLFTAPGLSRDDMQYVRFVGDNIPDGAVRNEVYSLLSAGYIPSGSDAPDTPQFVLVGYNGSFGDISQVNIPAGTYQVEIEGAFYNENGQIKINSDLIPEHWAMNLGSNTNPFATAFVETMQLNGAYVKTNESVEMAATPGGIVRTLSPFGFHADVYYQYGEEVIGRIKQTNAGIELAVETSGRDLKLSSAAGKVILDGSQIDVSSNGEQRGIITSDASEFKIRTPQAVGLNDNSKDILLSTGDVLDGTRGKVSLSARQVSANCLIKAPYLQATSNLKVQGDSDANRAQIETFGYQLVGAGNSTKAQFILDNNEVPVISSTANLVLQPQDSLILKNSYGLGLQAVNGEAYGSISKTGSYDLKLNAVSGAMVLDGSQIDVSSKKIVSLANGTDATDAVNFGQLTGVQADIIGGASSGYDTLGKIENKIGFILSNVDESAIDSITEVISAFQNADSSLMAMVTGIQANVASISGNYATNAYVSGEVSGLDARLDVLEGANKQQQQYQAITLDSTDIDNQYLTVTNTIVGTPWVMIDGVMARPTADFTVSNNNRINFAGDLASLGSSALVAGDVVHVYYMKNALLGA